MCAATPGLRRPLSGEIDIANVRRLREALIALDDESVGQILIDLADVTFIGSCGLAVLVATSKRCRVHGRELILGAPSRAVVLALAYSGLLHTFRYDAVSLEATSSGRSGCPHPPALTDRSGRGRVAARRPSGSGHGSDLAAQVVVRSALGQVQHLFAATTPDSDVTWFLTIENRLPPPAGRFCGGVTLVSG